MSLTLILGGKKSGKTTYILDKIKYLNEATLIVPEQNLFFYEKAILEKLGESKAFLLETISFNKLSKKLLKDDDQFHLLQLLNKDTKNLIINKIILNKKSQLTLFKDSVNKIDFSEQLSSQITEFKKYLVSVEKLEELSNNEEISGTLKEKLKDISIIYKEYEEELKGIFKDLDDLIMFAAKKVYQDKIFSNKPIFLDGFTGFTSQELSMISAFLDNNADVYISLLLDEERGETFGDLFHTTNLTKNQLLKMAADNGVDTNIVSLKTNYIKSEELSIIERNLYSVENQIYTKPVFDISIDSHKNIYFECLNAVSTIIGTIKTKGEKLKSFAVVVPEISLYKRYLEELFTDYDIPYYFNEKISIADLPVATLINTVLDLVTYSNSMDLILSYLKSGYFFKNDLDKIHKFENFLYTTGVKAYELFGQKTIEDILKDKENYGFKIFQKDDIIKVYKNAIVPLRELRGDIKGKTDAKSYSIAIYEFIKKIHLEHTINEYVKEFDDEGNIIKGEQFIQVYNSIIESLERAAIILGEDKVSFTTYKNIIKINMQNKNISSIPLLMDSVFITDVKGLKSNGFKFVFVLGANEGGFPKLGFSEGLINEVDRAALANFGINMSMSGELKILEEYLRVYDILTSPNEKLYISYPSYNFSNEELSPSSVVESLLNMFNKLKVQANHENQIGNSRIVFNKSIENVLNEDNEKSIEYLKYFLQNEKYKEIAEKTVKNIGAKTNQEVILNKEYVEKILGNEIKGSVTKFEKYRACGFSYYIKYILRGDEKKSFSVDVANIGSLRHLVIEEFSKQLKKEGIGFSDITDSYIDSKLDKIVDKSIKSVNNGVFLSTKRALFIAKKVKRSSKRTINLIKLHFTKGDFVPIGFEMAFGKDENELTGITINLKDDRKIHLTGVIDRVDKLKKDDGEYIRIVDYKSGYKTLDFYEIYYGLNIQLSVYMLTILNQDTLSKLKPGGVMYLTLDEPIVSIANPTQANEIEAQIKKKLIMKGILLNNLDVLESMDKEIIELNSSDIIDINIDKKGNLNEKNTLTLKQFNTMLEDVLKTIEGMSNKIYDGKFPIKPIRNNTKNACNYCPYSSICCFEQQNCAFDDLVKLSKEDIFKKVENEDE